ncbi:hypothetical protein PENDEC_c002G03494 [Penicillium decumbens]|uniref:Uncharacterized protein n=1 Tax=Penicillium decumbens TaxID=69771 RepID=A0A1V6PL69_PENDC|nr:hypothetical protein PENDEC_c002G03494 [Penicillium decumbens]
MSLPAPTTIPPPTPATIPPPTPATIPPPTPATMPPPAAATMPSPATPGPPAKKRRTLGLRLDWTLPAWEIAQAVAALQRRCRHNIMIAQVATINPGDNVAVPAEIVNRGIPKGPLTDLTIYSIMVAHKRTHWCRDNDLEFEQNHMLRGARPPRGKGVAIEAFGIRWIPEVGARTLLTGEELAKIFPYLTRTERPSSWRLLTIGRVTIPNHWVEGRDYDLVASPYRVTGPQQQARVQGDSEEARFQRAVLKNKAWPCMDTDPTRTVIIPRSTEHDTYRIMRLQDHPNFRIWCADPQLHPGQQMIERYDRDDSRLDQGLWDRLSTQPWPQYPRLDRDRVGDGGINEAAVSANESARMTDQVTRNDEGPCDDPPTMTGALIPDNEPGRTDAENTHTRTNTDAVVAAEERIRTPMVDRVAPLEPVRQPTESQVAHPPEATHSQSQDAQFQTMHHVNNDPPSPTPNIYTVVAERMNMPIANRDGPWQPLPTPQLSNSDFAAFTREATVTILNSMHLRNVAQARGVLTGYCSTYNDRSTAIFRRLSQEFMFATQRCHNASTEIATHSSQWRAAALINYILITWQYADIAITPSLRRPAITDMSAFLRMNPYNTLLLETEDKNSGPEFR